MESAGREGLGQREAEERLKKYGKNELPRKKRASDLKIFVRQLKSPLIYILLFASGITFFLRDYTDTAVIMAAVVLNTILGFYQERKAERALESLREFLHPTTTVVREGRRKEVPVEEIVPDDLVILSAGEKIPADGELVESYNLAVNEAILTGESAPVKKEIL